MPYSNPGVTVHFSRVPHLATFTFGGVVFSESNARTFVIVFVLFFFFGNPGFVSWRWSQMLDAPKLVHARAKIEENVGRNSRSCNSIEPKGCYARLSRESVQN